MTPFQRLKTDPLTTGSRYPLLNERRSRMIRMQEWADIAAAYHRGVSIKEIVRTTGLSRNTVRKAIRSENAPRYERPPVESKLDPYKNYLLERLDEYPASASRDSMRRYRR
jgi:transposase